MAPTMRRLLLMAGAVLALLGLSGLGLYRWVASQPIGTGETRISPDGRFTASVMDFHAEGFFNGKSERWYEFSVTGLGTAFSMRSTALPSPYFGSRSAHSVIRWEPDSAAVTFVFSASSLRVETGKEENASP